jgi:hypothetical protein
MAGDKCLMAGLVLFFNTDCNPNNPPANKTTAPVALSACFTLAGLFLNSLTVVVTFCRRSFAIAIRALFFFYFIPLTMKKR